MSAVEEFDPKGEFIEVGGVLFRRESAGQAGSDAKHVSGSHRGVALTATAVEAPGDAGGQRTFAFRAVHHLVIPAPGPALEEYAALLVELCRPAGLRQLLGQLKIRLTQLIYLLLGLREFLFGHRTTRGLQRDVVSGGAITREAPRPGDDGHEHADAARENPGPQVGGGVTQVGHARQPSTWAYGGVRWAALADLTLALLGLAVLVPALVLALALTTARMGLRVVTGR